MRISGISFKGYDPYPVNGGKVEKLEWETKHGWRIPDGGGSSSDNEDCFRSREEESEWWANYDRAHSAFDGDDDW